MHAEKGDLPAVTCLGKGFKQLSRSGRRFPGTVEVDQQVNLAIDILSHTIDRAVDFNTHFIVGIAIQGNIKNIIIAEPVVMFPRQEFPIADLID